MATALSTSAIPVLSTPEATTQPREGAPILIQMNGITSKVEFIDFVTHSMGESSHVKQMGDWDKVVNFFEFVQGTSSQKYQEYQEVKEHNSCEVAIEWTKIAIQIGELIVKFFPSEEGVSPEKDPLRPIKMQTALEGMVLIKINKELASLQS